MTEHEEAKRLVLGTQDVPQAIMVSPEVLRYKVRVRAGAFARIFLQTKDGWEERYLMREDCGYGRPVSWRLGGNTHGPTPNS